METLKDVIERAMSKTNCGTAYALNKHLGLARSTVDGWNSGKRHPNNKEAKLLADAAGMNFLEVLRIIGYEKARSENDRQFWLNFKEHGIAASLAVLGFAASPLLNILVQSVYYVKLPGRSGAGKNPAVSMS